MLIETDGLAGVAATRCLEMRRWTATPAQVAARDAAGPTREHG